MIPYGRQQITDADVRAVEAVLRSDFLTQGPVVPRFESDVAAKVGARHAVAVNSATSALHIACLALGVGPGDRVWTVPNTFVASANCARYCGADVDFVDIDRETWNMSVAALRDKLLVAQREGKLPKVVIPTHFAGQPTDEEGIWELAREFGFRVVEDASHAIGASRNGEPVGSCRWSDITIFSFHPVKIITSAEGGMALTNDDDLAETLRLLRTHGITRDANRFVALRANVDGVNSQAEPAHAPAWYYEQQLLGFNYRLTDLHAALGLSQLQRLSELVSLRNDLARFYDAALRKLPLILPSVKPEAVSAFHLYVVRLPSGIRDAVFAELRRAGIGVNLHYFPVHLQPYYRALGFGPGQFPEAEAYGRDAITLPLFPNLSRADQETVCSALSSAIAQHAGHNSDPRE